MGEVGEQNTECIVSFSSTNILCVYIKQVYEISFIV